MICKSELIRYFKFVVHQKNLEDTNLRLNNGFYLLYTMWITVLSETLVYQNEYSEDIEEKDLSYRLFKQRFRAYHYGVVDEDVDYYTQLVDRYSSKEAYNFLKRLSDKSELLSVFIESTVVRVISTSEFGILDLIHRDSVWKETYVQGKITPLKDKSILSANLVKYPRSSIG